MGRPEEMRRSRVSCFRRFERREWVELSVEGGLLGHLTGRAGININRSEKVYEYAIVEPVR